MTASTVALPYARPGTVPPGSTLRSALVWAIRYGIPGAAIKLAARRGDLVARSAADLDLRDDPSSLFAPLRELGPVVGNPFVSATAHHAVANEVLRHEAFEVDPAGAPFGWLQRVLDKALDPRSLGPIDAPGMLAIQPPDHTRVRKLVAHAFTPRAIANYTDRIRTLASELLDRVDPSGFDAARDYAALLPVAVIAEIIGVPVEMRDELLRTGNSIARTLDPVLSWRDWRAADLAARDIHSYLDEHIAALRRNPGDDLLSALIGIADADGSRLSDEELRVNTILLIGAGFETTVNLIGNGVGLLLRHPEQLAVLAENPSSWSNAVDEILRLESPVQLTLRKPRADVRIAGQTQPAGRPMLLMLGAANRDPAVFDDPDRFDVARPNARAHLAFSAGIHYCVGAQLAKLEGAVALQTLFERFPDLTPLRPGTRRGTRVLFGWESLPVVSPSGSSHAGRTRRALGDTGIEPVTPTVSRQFRAS